MPVGCVVLRLIPVLYSAARLRGLEADLHLTGQEFPTLLSILYVGYILMQIPSCVLWASFDSAWMLIDRNRNLFLNWMGKPSLHLPFCMIIWGMISCLTGVTRKWVSYQIMVLDAIMLTWTLTVSLVPCWLVSFSDLWRRPFSPVLCF